MQKSSTKIAANQSSNTYKGPHTMTKCGISHVCKADSTYENRLMSHTIINRIKDQKPPDKSQQALNKHLTKSNTVSGFPHSSVGKESACNAGEPGSIPGSGRAPGEGNGNPLQHSCLKNPMDRGTWQGVGHDLVTTPPQHSFTINTMNKLEIEEDIINLKNDN